ncbi:MAG TPA: 50S ribosomal protein L10 [Candidatus Limnocylindrales bacterium]|nr:50S ribosomal protein L10 [Candidatus Limnocylindrales bacterium]
MAITKQRKEDLVAIYSNQLANTDGFIIAHYNKLSVAQANNLRKKLADSGGTYMVTKNTLFKIALKQNDWPVPEELLSGMVGIVFGNGNLPAVAKSMQSFIKEAPDNFSAIGGVLAGSVFKASDVEAIANLPTIEEIRAQLAGLIVTPASQIAGLLQAATSQLVNVLQAYEDKQSDAA